MRFAFPIALLLGCLACQAGAAPAPVVVKARMFANVETVAPGKPFLVGVMLRIRPGWHVYWINPGDSGVATEVKIKAPEGFRVGEVRFPMPVRFDQPGDAVGYGYSDAVMFIAEVLPPNSLEGLGELEFTAEVSWLCCNDTCIPGKAEPSVKVLAGKRPEPANQELFLKWNQAMPLKRGDPHNEAAEWSVDPAAGTMTRAIPTPRGSPLRKVELFPHSSDAVAVDRIDVEAGDDATRITVKARLLPGRKLGSPALPALLVMTTDEGQRLGGETALPVGKLPRPPAENGAETRVKNPAEESRANP